MNSRPCRIKRWLIETFHHPETRLKPPTMCLRFFGGLRFISQLSLPGERLTCSVAQEFKDKAARVLIVNIEDVAGDDEGASSVADRVFRAASGKEVLFDYTTPMAT